MTDELFPSSVRELAQAGQLGDPVRVFHPKSFRLLMAVVLRRPGPVPVYLFEGGLVRPPEAYNWDELSTVIAAGVRRRREGRTRWRLTIETTDGRTARLEGGLSDLDRLGEVIVSEVMRRVVPAYVATIESGGTVELGPFLVSGKGVEKDAELIPWSAIRDVGMSNGVVYLHRFDQVITTAVTADRMPNAAAFIALCRHFGAPEEATQEPAQMPPQETANGQAPQETGEEATQEPAGKATQEPANGGTAQESAQES
jgi:hypothetical protein